MPPDGWRLWDWFLQLDATRGFNDGSVLSLSFQEIDAWNRLTGSQVSPKEVDILRSMDAVRTRIWNEKKADAEPDRLIDASDTSSIAALFRGMVSKE